MKVAAQGDEIAVAQYDGQHVEKSNLMYSILAQVTAGRALAVLKQLCRVHGLALATQRVPTTIGQSTDAVVVQVAQPSIQRRRL